MGVNAASPRGQGCESAAVLALNSLHRSCTPTGVALRKARAGPCLVPRGTAAPRCVVQSGWANVDGVGSQVHHEMESLHEALQLNCLWVPRGLNSGVAHGVNKSVATAVFNLVSSPDLARCPHDAPPAGLRRSCPTTRDVRTDPSAARKLRTQLPGSWCQSRSPPLEFYAPIFDNGMWLHARAVLRARYASGALSSLLAAPPWFGGSAPAQWHARRELHVAAHVRRGDTHAHDWGKWRNLSIHHVASSLATVVRHAAKVLPPSYVVWLHVVTDGPWRAHDDHAVRLMVSNDAENSAAESRDSAVATTAALLPQSAPPVPKKRWRLSTHVGGDPFVALAHLSEADVLVADNSDFSRVAAQVSVGVQVRMARRGFSAADLQHMLPLPLMNRSEARAYATSCQREHCDRLKNVGCADDEASLLADSGELFRCRLKSYVAWRTAAS